MKILILGYSDLVQRKIIPAIKKFKRIKYDIASKSKKEQNCGHEKWYRDYIDAIYKSNANIVYISLTNSLHFSYALKSLNSNKNVIVDKPITLSLKQTKKLTKIARKKKLLISEALVFNYHKQFLLIKKLIKKNKISLNNIIMQFCIPKPPKNNFKLSKIMGGGCFNDMSPYAAAVKRLFMGKKIKFVKVISKYSNKLSEEFCLTVCSKKINFIGIFSHNSEYKNDITFLAKSYLISAKRFSAPPANMDLIVNFRKKNKLKKLIVKKDDMFMNYLNEYFQKLKSKNFLYYQDRILEDAKFVNKLKTTK